MFVEVDDLGALLKTEQDVEVGAFATVERGGFLDMIGDAVAFLGPLEYVLQVVIGTPIARIEEFALVYVLTCDAQR